MYPSQRRDVIGTVIDAPWSIAIQVWKVLPVVEQPALHWHTWTAQLLLHLSYHDRARQNAC